MILNHKRKTKYFVVRIVGKIIIGICFVRRWELKKSSSFVKAAGRKGLLIGRNKNTVMKLVEEPLCGRKQKMTKRRGKSGKSARRKTRTGTHRLVLIDGNHMAHRVYYKLQGLATSSNEGTGVIYGVLNSLRKLRRKLNTHYLASSFNHVVAVWDGGGPSPHRRDHPTYKKNRQKDADLEAQIKVIRKAIRYLGIPSLRCKGIEADDIISVIAKCLSFDGWVDAVTIVSSDKDFLQLLDERINLYDPIAEVTWRQEDFAKKYEIHPISWIDVKALMGDKGDNIDGIRGIGIQRALKLVKKYGTADKAVLSKGLEGYRDLVENNLYMITLPTDVDALNPKHILYLRSALRTEKNVDEKRLWKFLRRYEINSILRNFDKWVRVFKGART